MVQIIKFSSNLAVCWALNASSTSCCWALNASVVAWVFAGICPTKTYALII